ncbi:MAG: hypothetical protein J6J97_01455 [Akkermansia sp.]|nr:hypothetical protein [Akkermansia sp.]
MPPSSHRPESQSTGQRCMGWLLVLTPTLGALSLSIAAALIPGHEPAWHDYLTWQIPHLLLVISGMVFTTVPALVGYWLLCRLGDKLEKRGARGCIIWPLVILLCTLAGCELLWNITGLWVTRCPYTTLALFGSALFTLTLWLTLTGRSLIGNSNALYAIYGGLAAISAFWFLHALADGELFVRRSVFGASSPRASWNNPLLPAKQFNTPPYHSWIFEAQKVIQATHESYIPRN